MKRLEEWRCPKCEAKVEARGATSVVHRCPSDKSRSVAFMKVSRVEEVLNGR